MGNVTVGELVAEFNEKAIVDAAQLGDQVALSALYLVAGLAIRERAWKRLMRPVPSTHSDRLAGRRVF